MRTWHRVAIAIPTTVAAASLLLAGVAAGDGNTNHTETDDAGQLPGVEQVLAAAPGSISGTLGHGQDVDLYRFCAADQGFSVSTVNAATTIDTELFVFHGDGAALAHSDDRDGTYQSRVTITAGSVPAGEYLVAVGSWNTTAVNRSGQSIFEEVIAQQAGPTPGMADVLLDHWVLEGRSSGDYRIDVTGATDCTSTGPAEVGVDVKPGDDGNPVNVRSRGVTPIALLGSEDLDVTTISPETIVAGPGGAPLARPSAFEDVDEDGHVDLVGHVRTQELGLTTGDTELCVDASAGAQALQGCDAVSVR